MFSEMVMPEMLPNHQKNSVAITFKAYYLVCITVYEKQHWIPS